MESDDGKGDHWETPDMSQAASRNLDLRQLPPIRLGHNGASPPHPPGQSSGPRGLPTLATNSATEDHRRRRSQSAVLQEDMRTVADASFQQSRRESQGHEEEDPMLSTKMVDNRRFSETSRSTSEGFELKETSEDEETDDEETGLTKADQRKRRRRKGRNTLLDERTPEDTDTSKKERKLADISVLKKSAINALLIGLWYLFSLSISIYNKWMFSPDHLDFKFPLFTTCLHMLVQFSFASLVLYIFPHFRPRSDSISNPHNTPNGPGSDDELRSKKPLMTVQYYLTRIAPCGTATGLDIGLGNMSLKFISLTFFTMCKSSALAFVLLFAFLFRLETPSIRLCLIILTMTLGVIMMVAGEAAFDLLGFCLIISSAFFSGFRWALTQILLLRNPATSNPFSSIFFLAPIMFLALALLAFPIEGPAALVAGLRALTAEKGALLGTAMLLFPGVLAFCMTASEFALLQRTSVVTLSICGIFKEVVTISAAGIVFHDPLTPINVSGLVVTIASIAAYNWIKVGKMRREARERVKGGEGVGERGEEREPMLEGEGRRESGIGVLATLRTSLAFGEGAGRISEGRERLSPTKRTQDLE